MRHTLTLSSYYCSYNSATFIQDDNALTRVPVLYGIVVISDVFIREQVFLTGGHVARLETMSYSSERSEFRLPASQDPKIRQDVLPCIRLRVSHDC